MSLLFTQEVGVGEFQVYSDRPEHLNCIEVKQTHSHKVITYIGTNLKKQEADGIIISLDEVQKGNIPAIKTADCLPVLFYSDTHVALVHAGWRGIYNKILISSMLTQLGPSQIFIGPSIHHYIVQSDFKQYFPHETYFTNDDNGLLFDLQKAAIDQMNSHFKNVKLINSNICTFENSQYNSYRRDKTEKRNWNIFKV